MGALYLNPPDADIDPGPVPSDNVQLTDIPLTRRADLVVDHADLHTPSTPARACWTGDEWIMQ